MAASIDSSAACKGSIRWPTIPSNPSVSSRVNSTSVSSNPAILSGSSVMVRSVGLCFASRLARFRLNRWRAISSASEVDSPFLPRCRRRSRPSCIRV